MITNENEFLGILIKYADNNKECDINKIIKEINVPELDCMAFINSLVSKNIISFVALGIYRINPIAHEIYVKPSKKVAKSIFKLSIGFLKFFITYILGIISGIIIAVASSGIENHFGW